MDCDSGAGAVPTEPQHHDPAPKLSMVLELIHHQCHTHRGRWKTYKKKTDKCKENQMKLLKTETIAITIVLALLLWGMEEGRWHVENPGQERATAGVRATLAPKKKMLLWQLFAERVTERINKCISGIGLDRARALVSARYGMY